MQPNNQAQKPFFAKFLENQANAKVTTAQQEAGLTAEQAESQTTLKFPSDWDEEDW
ncbi:microviridin/marinostatin family tricyclic proteinase inhibitor [uncultured Chitinophaga sp.]|jgi:hypothetical protein|uniref:microviridin/marinostatin family tricyclic proteinase inhibitor n=1 Tax=uncultured Chitinophaga sp. TaxID=339340 RepID=UPI0004143535|nr:microviridin/marinostatin family tricyclic proteinase inhibitor [uncultured Chitinophaga sp.]